jgi:NAD(P)H-dependent nitrite reductase small subunit
VPLLGFGGFSSLFLRYNAVKYGEQFHRAMRLLPSSGVCMGEYIRVASVNELPTDTGYVVEVGGQEIALFKVGDAVYAIENECPHREGPLGEGELEEDIVTCPFHAWQINVRTGEVVFNPSICARTFPCKVEDGEVLVAV